MKESCGDCRYMEGMEFRFYGREGDTQFKYMELPLDKTNDNWLEVQQKFKRVQKVWGRLGKMLQREGEGIKVSVTLYMEVVQAVLLFASEYWVLSEAMEKIMEGAHAGLLIQFKVKQPQRNMGGTWLTPSTR